MRAHALRVVNHAGRRHPESGRHGGVRQLSGAHRSPRTRATTFPRKHFEDTSTRPWLLYSSADSRKAFVDNKAVWVKLLQGIIPEPQVTIPAKPIASALCLARLVSRPGAISALAQLHAAPLVLAHGPTSRRARTPTGRDWRLSRRGNLAWRTASPQREAQHLGRQPRLPAWSKEATDGQWDCTIAGNSSRDTTGSDQPEGRWAALRVPGLSAKMGEKPSLVRFCNNRTDQRLPTAALQPYSEVEGAARRQQRRGAGRVVGRSVCQRGSYVGEELGSSSRPKELDEAVGCCRAAQQLVNGRVWPRLA
uniref:Uncharacterized protein n=1 Tax=Macrostomum lignano TaxID=282301 RepID=A0A1I8F641_9PLAT